MLWNYALDLGAEEIRMVLRGTDGMYTEAARAAFRRGETEPFARGENALEYEGREAAGITVKPITKAGLPLGYNTAARWARRVIGLHEKKMPGKKTVLLSVSPFMEESERAMFLRALVNEGLDAAGTVESDMASAVGAGADLAKPAAYTVMDLGASRISCSCIAAGSRIKFSSLSYGMDMLDEVIANSAAVSCGMLLGREAVRSLKHGVAETGLETIRVPALSSEKRLPVYADIPKSIVENAIDGLVTDLARLAENTVSYLPDGCARDVIENGIILTGGGANCYGLDKKLKQRLGVPVTAAKAAGKCAINGMKAILEEQDRYTLLISDWRDTGMRG